MSVGIPLITTFKVRSSGREKEVNAIPLALNADRIFLKLVGHFINRRTDPLESILAVKSLVLSSVASSIVLADLRQLMELMMIGGILILVSGLGLREDGLLVDDEGIELIPLDSACSDPATEADRERLPLSMITFVSGFDDGGGDDLFFFGVSSGGVPTRLTPPRLWPPRAITVRFGR